MKHLKSLLILAAGIFIAFSPEIIGLVFDWRANGNGDLIAYLSLVFWPLGAVISTFGLVMALQRGHKPAPSQTVLTVLIICAGIYLAQQAWFALQFIEDSSGYFKIAAYAAGALVLLILGLKRAVKR